MKTLIKIYFIFLVSIGYLTTLQAQQIPPEFLSSCGTQSPPIELGLTGGENQTCNQVSLDFSNASVHVPFIPGPDDNVKTVRVNLLFIRDDNGYGHFDPQDAEAMSVWDDIESSVNTTYANLVEPNYTGTNSTCEDTYADFIVNSKIQFEFNRVFIDDTNLFNASQLSCGAYGIRADIQSQLDVLHPELRCNNSMNIVMPTDAGNLTEVLNGGDYTSCFNPNATWPSTTNFEAIEYTHLPNRYSKYLFMKDVLPGSDAYPNETWEDAIRS